MSEGQYAALKADNVTYIQNLISMTTTENLLFRDSSCSDPLLQDSPSLLSASLLLSAQKCFHLLVNSGASISLNDSKKRSPIHFAAAGGSIDLFNELLSMGLSMFAEDVEYRIPLHYACMRGNIDLVRFLWIQGSSLSRKANGLRSQSGITSLHFAAESGSVETVQFLIENEQKIDAETLDGKTPLHYAKNYEVFKLLVENGASETKKDLSMRTPIEFAMEKQFFYRKGEDADNLLFNSCLNGNFNSVKFLMENSQEPNIKDELCRTPLYFAVQKNHITIVELLLENRADPNFSDSSQNSPLHIAAEKDFVEIAEILIKFGADLKAKNKNNRTPKMMAERNNSKKFLRKFKNCS